MGSRAPGTTRLVLRSQHRNTKCMVAADHRECTKTVANCHVGGDVLLSDQELVGHRIGVLWPEHGSYFLGRITAYSQEAGSFISSSSTLFTRASPRRQ